MTPRLNVVRFCVAAGFVAGLASTACSPVAPDFSEATPITLTNSSGVPIIYAAYEAGIADRSDFIGHRHITPGEVVVQPGSAARISPTEVQGYVRGASVFLLIFEVQGEEAFSMSADGNHLWYLRLSQSELRARGFRVEVTRQ